MRTIFALLCVAAIAACEAAPENQSIGRLSIERAWASPTSLGVDVSAGYLTIANGSESDDRLIAVTSPRAARVEIHDMSMNGAVMRMRAVESLAIPAGDDVTLAPGGMHVMFFGVSEPFSEGQDIPVALTFETAGKIDVSLRVRRTAPASHSQQH